MSERERVLLQFTANAMEWALILLPLMVYLMVLGQVVNRRRQPLVVRGTRNMMGLLAGLSGFLLLGPPSWIAHLFLRGGPVYYWLAYLGYLLVLALICWRIIARQRRVLVIYNIHPSVFAEVLQEVLNSLGVPYTATPGRVAFADGQLVLDIDTSALFNNVSLRWYGSDDPLRHTVEQQVIKAVGGVEAGDNPGAGLLSFAATLLLMFIVLATVLYFFGPALLAWLRSFAQ